MIQAATAPPPGFWHATLDALPDSVAVLDAHGVVLAVNRAWDRFAEGNGGLVGTVGLDYLEICDRAGDAPGAIAAAQALREMLAGQRCGYEGIYPCPAPGIERWFSMRAARFDDGDRARVVVVHHDITLRFVAERRNHEQAALLSAVDAAIISTDLTGSVTHWSDGAAILFGWSEAEVLGRPVASVTVGPGNQVLSAEIVRAVLETGEWEGAFDVRHRNGDRFPAYVRNRILRDAAGRAAGFLGVIVDISRTAAAQRRLLRVRNFLGAVTDTMADGLCVLDASGDVTLVNQAAERMLGWPRDELLGTSMGERVHALAADGSLRGPESTPLAPTGGGEPVRVDDDVFLRRDGTFLPVSYSCAPLTLESGEEGFVVVFSDISERHRKEEALRMEVVALSWVHRIQKALQDDRFVLYAQPIQDLRSGEVVQHELLVRMLGPDGEIIPPNDFLPVAEEHGLIGELDRWVFARAFAYAALGHAVEVNVSAESLADPGLLDYIEELLARHDVDPPQVVFEITETALINREREAFAFVESLVALGFGVALDDFGTGYGSFHYLKHLPVTLLKIDQQFVSIAEVGDEAANLHVIHAVVSLAQGMGQRTVAEGIETASELETVKRLGVDFAQGYLIGRPRPADEVFGITTIERPAA